MAKVPDKKLTRAEKRELNKRNHAAAKKTDAKGQGVPVTAKPALVATEVTPRASEASSPPPAPPPPVLSAIAPDSYDPPTPPDDRAIDFEHRPQKNGRDLVKVLQAIGVTREGIARQLTIAPSTLDHFYGEELTHGAEAILAAVGVRAVQGALSGEPRMVAHVTKSLLGWGQAKAKPPFRSVVMEVEAQAAAMAGGTAAEGRVAAGGTVRVTMKLSEHITVREEPV